MDAVSHVPLGNLPSKLEVKLAASDHACSNKVVGARHVEKNMNTLTTCSAHTRRLRTSDEALAATAARVRARLALP